MLVLVILFVMTAIVFAGSIILTVISHEHWVKAMMSSVESNHSFTDPQMFSKTIITGWCVSAALFVATFVAAIFL